MQSGVRLRRAGYKLGFAPLSSFSFLLLHFSALVANKAID